MLPLEWLPLEWLPLEWLPLEWLRTQRNHPAQGRGGKCAVAQRTHRRSPPGSRTPAQAGRAPPAVRANRASVGTAALEGSHRIFPSAHCDGAVHECGFRERTRRADPRDPCMISQDRHVESVHEQHPQWRSCGILQVVVTRWQWRTWRSRWATIRFIDWQYPTLLCKTQG